MKKFFYVLVLLGVLTAGVKAETTVKDFALTSTTGAIWDTVTYAPSFGFRLVLTDGTQDDTLGAQWKNATDSARLETLWKGYRYKYTVCNYYDEDKAIDTAFEGWCNVATALEMKNLTKNFVYGLYYISFEVVTASDSTTALEKVGHYYRYVAENDAPEVEWEMVYDKEKAVDTFALYPSYGFKLAFYGEVADSAKWVEYGENHCYRITVRDTAGEDTAVSYAPATSVWDGAKLAKTLRQYDGYELSVTLMYVATKEEREEGLDSIIMVKIDGQVAEYTRWFLIDPNYEENPVDEPVLPTDPKATVGEKGAVTFTWSFAEVKQAPKFEIAVIKNNDTTSVAYPSIVEDDSTGTFGTNGSVTVTLENGTYAWIIRGIVLNPENRQEILKASEWVAGNEFTVEGAANEAAVLAGVKVYPNPSNGQFNLLVPENADVQIYAANGALMQNVKVAAGVHAFDIRQAGLYIVKVVAGNKVSVNRVVVR